MRRLLGAQGFRSRHRDIGRIGGGRQRRGIGRHPGRIIGVLHEAGGGIQHLGQFVIGMDVGPQGLAALARHKAVPIGEVAVRMARQNAVVEIEDTPVAIAIDDVEHRHLDPAQRLLEFAESVGAGHIPILLQHEGAVQPGHLDRHQRAVPADEHRALDAGADLHRLGLERAVPAPDAHGLLRDGEFARLAVEHIAILTGRRQLVGRRPQDGVDRVGEAEMVVEDEAQHRQADLGRAIHLEPRPRQLGLVIGEIAGRPGQMRIGQQHRMAARRARRRHRPGVGPAGRPLDRRQHLLLGSDIDVVHQPMGVRHHIDAADRQDLPHLWIQLVAMIHGEGVYARGEGIEVGAELRSLLVVPPDRPRILAVGDQPAVLLGEAVTPIFGGAGAGLAIEMQQQISVAFGLGPAEAVKHPGLGQRTDMRHPESVPQDLAMRRSGGLGSGGGGAGGGQQQKTAQRTSKPDHAEPLSGGDISTLTLATDPVTGHL